MIIDLSHNNGKPNFDLIIKDQQGIKGVFIKATEGVGYIDPEMARNAAEAQRVGLPLTYYHFATLNTTNVEMDAKAEALAFLAAIGGHPANFFPLVLDIERFLIINGKTLQLTKEQFFLWIKTFCDTIEAAGKKVSIYGGKFFLDTNLPENHGLGKYELWLARYMPCPTPPPLPKGWDKMTLWQYSCRGSVLGISGYVDLNK